VILAGLEDLTLVVDAAVRDRSPGAASDSKDPFGVYIVRKETAEDL
jgi:hypothetical protein